RSCKRLSVRFSLLPLTSRSIHQPFAFAALHRFARAFGVGDLAAVPTKLNLGRVARQMFRRDVVERADDAALQQCIPRLGGVGMNAVARIFASPVVDALVLAAE